MENMTFDAVMERYADTVYRLALNQTANRADAEDITQEVFLYLFKSGKSFDTEEYAKAWLIRCTINRCRSLFRSAYRRHTVTLETLPEIASADTFSDRDESAVYIAVQNLPAKYKAVIHLFYFEDMPIADIAAATGQKENTVKSLLSRGRKRLEKML